MAKKSTYLREQRDAALFDAYIKAVRDIGFSTQEMAYDYVRTHEAPRFFVEPKFCQEIISKIERGLPTGLRNPQSIRKYDELYRRFKQMRKENPDMPMRDICEAIVDGKAPEFYLNRRITQWIIGREKRMKWERMEKRRG